MSIPYLELIIYIWMYSKYKHNFGWIIQYFKRNISKITKKEINRTLSIDRVIKKCYTGNIDGVFILAKKEVFKYE